MQNLDQKLETPADKPSRPRTRAWVKQEQNNRTKSTPNREIASLPQHRNEFQRRGSGQNQSNRSERDRTQGIAHTKSRSGEGSGPIVSQVAGAKQPNRSRRQVDAVTAKRRQQRRGAEQGQVIITEIPQCCT